MRRYDRGALVEVIGQLFRGAGLSPADASLCGDWLVDAEASGVSSHGIARVPMYLAALRRGKIATHPAITVEQPRPGVVLVDGGNGLGAVVGAVAIDRAIAAASATGIAFASVRNSNHYGAAGYLLQRATNAGYAAITCSNGSPVMAVWGGADRLLGTNPIAAAFPAAEPRDALAFDMSTSVAAFGKIRQAQRRGEAIPDDWALAPDGSRTTDPADAMRGAMLPFGGAKGSALALMVEMLAGVLSGSALGPAVGNPNDAGEQAANVGHAFIVIDPRAFMPTEVYEQRAAYLGALVRGARPLAGTEGARVPGTGAASRRSDAAANGVWLADDIVELLEKELSPVGLSLPAPTTSATI